MYQSILAFIMAIISFISSFFSFAGSPDLIVLKDVSYGTEKNQNFDLYIPTDSGDTLGLILEIHGGAWITGDKSTYRSECKNIAENYGYAAATINHRFLSDSVSMYDILADVNAAVAKIAETASSKGYKIDKMITSGLSSGAHLALMYAYHTPSDAAIKPVAVFSQSAPTNFMDPNYLSSSNSLQRLPASSPDGLLPGNISLSSLVELSPVTYASTAVPTVMAHGKKDSIVPYSNAESLDKALTENGIKHVFITYPNSGHELGSDPDCSAEYTRQVVDYAAEYLK